MSEDRHENILQKLEKQQQKHGEEEEEEKDKGFEKDGEKEDDDEEEETLISKKDDDEDNDHDNDEIVASRKDDDDDEVEECKTPSSSDHKIPVIQSCPPAPRKKAMMSINSHKRKFSELQFFETTSEEVESYFRSNSEPFSTNNSAAEPRCLKKRRCRSA